MGYEGETIPSTIHQAPQLLPRAVHVDFAEGRRVVIEYEDWKIRVKAKQQAELTAEETEVRNPGSVERGVQSMTRILEFIIKNEEKLIALVRLGGTFVEGTLAEEYYYERQQTIISCLR